MNLLLSVNSQNLNKKDYFYTFNNFVRLYIVYELRPIYTKIQ